MVFDSPVYFVFLILVVAIYWQLGCRAQNWLLLVSGYFFYGWWNYCFLLLMGASTCINYYLSHCFEEIDDSSAPKRLLICALVVNFSFLGFFKYCNFFALLTRFGVSVSNTLILLRVKMAIA